MSKRKQPFELGADVERALMEIISINDDLPAEVKDRIEQMREDDDNDGCNN
jgi:hypothetical protein